MSIEQYVHSVGKQAREASRAMARADSNAKNTALRAIATAIRREAGVLVAANREDLAAAVAAGLEPALLDRLTLSEKGVAAMAEGVEQVAALDDPVGGGLDAVVVDGVVGGDDPRGDVEAGPGDVGLNDAHARESAAESSTWVLARPGVRAGIAEGSATTGQRPRVSDYGSAGQ